MRQRLDQVRELLRSSIESPSLRCLADDLGPCLDGGKLLRARLLLRLADVTALPLQAQVCPAAAVELVHAASLLHDDVIDQGRLRRGKPTLWVRRGVDGAILLGDLLFCRAVSLLAQACDASLILSLAGLSQQMCAAELEQALRPPDESPDWTACVQLARRKTGSLFAFAAEAAAGPSPPLRQALREAGYAVGTAYQLADDMLDAFGDPRSADKTLRSDQAGGRSTALQAASRGGVDPVAAARELCGIARAALAAWPALQAAWDGYMSEDMLPVIDGFVGSFRR